MAFYKGLIFIGMSVDKKLGKLIFVHVKRRVPVVAWLSLPTDSSEVVRFGCFSSTQPESFDSVIFFVACSTQALISGRVGSVGFLHCYKVSSTVTTCPLVNKVITFLCVHYRFRLKSVCLYRRFRRS